MANYLSNSFPELDAFGHREKLRWRWPSPRSCWRRSRKTKNRGFNLFSRRF